MSRNTIGLLFSLLLFSTGSTTLADNEAEVRELLGPPVRFEELRSHGPDVLPVLAGGVAAICWKSMRPNRH
jgi:hypothetical protein